MKCTSGSYQFSLNTGASATFALAKQGTDCSEDYVGIEGIISLLHNAPNYPKGKLILKNKHINLFYEKKFLKNIFLKILASSHTGCGNLKSVYCGGIFNDFTSATIDTLVTDCTAPFEVSIVTDATTDGTAATIAGSIRGVCLEYTQIPCGAGNQCAF